MVTRLDRLGRDMFETVTTIADHAEREINVQVLDPTLDTSRPADKVVVHVMASLAEWERELLVERTREGVAHAALRAASQVLTPSSAMNRPGRRASSSTAARALPPSLGRSGSHARRSTAPLRVRLVPSTTPETKKAPSRWRVSSSFLG